ncbi:protease SohB [Spongiibacter sp. KMU-166]|uniref:Protease SohB n=1 Tax=Spongiibacter thalassae TaxID=2721624 RepID=A0ABX1GG07_9GAMM|nr:protease SohB [Spongiibacter thalassae]NKI17373.1 protease SohB [Spongiibacter thalassae]
MDFIVEYGLFLAKSITALLFIVLLLGAVFSMSQRSKREGEDGQIEVTALHHRFEDWQDTMAYSVLPEGDYKKLQKDRKKQEKAEKKGKKDSKPERKRLFVLDFDGDIQASAVDNLREEISAILTIIRPEDEVLLRLESPGGLVHSYGLAASQLLRLRQRNIPLTIAIDRVAASGGYMMACTGTRLLAAPFAVIGSIGVVAQVPNIHRLLKKHDVDIELHTAGEHKRTLTMLGENTEEGRKKFVEELEETHVLFKEFVSEYRPQLDIDSIATGEVWYGRRAVDKALIDEVATSDDYLLSRRETTDIFAVHYKQKRSLPERLGFAAEAAVDRGTWKIIEKLRNSRFIG